MGGDELFGVGTVRRVVIVNGVPASGKTTVACALRDISDWPLIALDTIKTPFFDEVDSVSREFNRKLGRAAYAAIFATIAGFPDECTVITEAWFGFQPPEALKKHLERASVENAAQIWCYAPPDVIGERYAARVPLRSPQHPGLEYVPELIALAKRAEPMSDYPTLNVDTTKPINIGVIRAFLDQTGFPRV